MERKSQKFRRLGVLGGMGVEATIELLKRVHAATDAQDDQDHVPLFVDMNPQVPSRIRHLIEKNGDDPGPVIAEMAIRLEKAGAAALAMPCNTAHHYADWVESAVKIPLLNMPLLTCCRLATSLSPGSRVGILASPATNQTGLFDAFLKDVGLIAMYPEDEAPVLSSIRRIKKTGPAEEDLALLDQESERLTDRGASGIIIGCTEFSLLSSRISATAPVVDALDVLVEEIVAYSGAKQR
ncbi:MAG: aspartate/glutamate racemase family protein [Rhizobiaceae bacterium]